MSFLKEITLQNGAVSTFHKILRLETLENCTKLQALVASWANYESYVQNKTPIGSQYVEIPMYNLYTQAETDINTMEPFIDSVIVTDVPQGLTGEKIKKWWEIKLKRDQVEFAGFTYNSMVFDSDIISQSRIQGAVIMAMQNSSFTVTWTLKDNSTVLLTAAEVIAVGQALAQHVETVHAHSQELRALVEAATTSEQLLQIVW